MASAISITGRSRNDRARRAFTLAEVIISMSVGSLLFGMVMSAVVTQTKLAASTGNYEEMNRQGRVALKVFEADMRQARNLLATTSYSNGYDPSRINVEIVTAVASDGTVTKDTVSYGYDAAKKTLWREQPAGSNRRTLLTDIASCRINYFGLNDNPLPCTSNPTPSPIELRKVLLSATLSKSLLPAENRENLVSTVVVLRKPLL